MVTHEIAMEASELGFPPGMWPMQLTHGGVVFTWLRTMEDRDGDVAANVYRNYDWSVILTVFND